MKPKMSIYSIGDLSSTRVQGNYEACLSCCRIAPHELSTEDTVPRNTRETKREMEPEVRALLEAFYAPFNERLFALIGKRLDNSW